VDLKIAVAVLGTLTVGLIAVLWMLGRPTQRSGLRSPQHPARPLVPWLASLAGQGLGGQARPDTTRGTSSP
jgi:hypothetical protein